MLYDITDPELCHHLRCPWGRVDRTADIGAMLRHPAAASIELRAIPPSGRWRPRASRRRRNSHDALVQCSARDLVLDTAMMFGLSLTSMTNTLRPVCFGSTPYSPLPIALAAFSAVCTTAFGASSSGSVSKAPSRGLPLEVIDDLPVSARHVITADVQVPRH